MQNLSSNHFSVHGDKDNLKRKRNIHCWGSIHDATSSFLRHAARIYKPISNPSTFCKTKIGHLWSTHAILWVHIFLPTVLCKSHWQGCYRRPEIFKIGIFFCVSLWTKNISSILWNVFLFLSSNQKFSKRKKENQMRHNSFQSLSWKNPSWTGTQWTHKNCWRKAVKRRLLIITSGGSLATSLSVCCLLRFQRAPIFVINLVRCN